MARIEDLNRGVSCREARSAGIPLDNAAVAVAVLITVAARLQADKEAVLRVSREEMWRPGVRWGDGAKERVGMRPTQPLTTDVCR